jgi:hypothetical protein
MNATLEETLESNPYRCPRCDDLKQDDSGINGTEVTKLLLIPGYSFYSAFAVNRAIAREQNLEFRRLLFPDIKECVIFELSKMYIGFAVIYSMVGNF